MKTTYIARLGLIALLSVGFPGAHAHVFRCIAANGAVSYQDHACAPNQAQTLVDVPSRPPPGYVPPAPMSSGPPPASPPSLAAPTYVSPPPPLPVMYTCIGYVNGESYLTAHPPGPYLAPLGVMGYPPQTLAQAYGAPHGAGVSAPELAPKPRAAAPSIAAGMTEVQDYCLPATHAQVCRFLRQEYDGNHRKLRMAMPRKQRPYKQREKQLAAELKNC